MNGLPKVVGARHPNCPSDVKAIRTPHKHRGLENDVCLGRQNVCGVHAQAAAVVRVRVCRVRTLPGTCQSYTNPPQISDDLIRVDTVSLFKSIDGRHNKESFILVESVAVQSR